METGKPTPQTPTHNGIGYPMTQDRRETIRERRSSSDESRECVVTVRRPVKWTADMSCVSLNLRLGLYA
jgi:hypothetical protein